MGLGRPEARAWAIYDWANSAVWTSVIATIFPVYFYRVAAADLSGSRAMAAFAVATTIGLVIVAAGAPALGVFADLAARRKRMLAVMVCFGAAATASLFFVGRGDWLLALVLFVGVEIGVSGSCVFYDSLLPHVASGDEVDRLSTSGYALGYLGGGILLALNLAWITWPGWFGMASAGPGDSAQATLPARLAFVSAAAWWVLFSIPLFRTVAEPPACFGVEIGDGVAGAIVASASRLRRIFDELRAYPQAVTMLLAILIYSDGIGTLIRMATIYGAEVGIGQGALFGSFLLVQFISIPFALLFGRFAGMLGSKRAILVGLAGYTATAVFAYFMSRPLHFLMLALAVGAVQGGTQALSRSLFASLIPRHKSAEFFGFFAVTERFAGIIGPLVFAATAALTGTSRNAIVSIMVFFVAGAAVLTRVDVVKGRRAAAESGPADAGDVAATGRAVVAVARQGED